MKNALTTVLALSLMFTACQTAEAPQDAMPQEVPFEYETYNSSKFGLSFDYLDGMTVSENTNTNGSFLYISMEDYTNFEGEIPATTIFLIEGQTLEKRLEELNVTETEEETIGENTYTVYTATSEFDGQEHTSYLIQDSTQVIEIHEGSEVFSEESLSTLLETLSL